LKALLASVCDRAGAGRKDYIVAGPEPFPQPIPQIATLVANDVWKVVFDVGGELTFRPRDHLLLRAEFLNYTLPFPARSSCRRPTILRAASSNNSRRFLV